jgi:hypothetical protein
VSSAMYGLCHIQCLDQAAKMTACVIRIALSPNIARNSNTVVLSKVWSKVQSLINMPIASSMLPFLTDPMYIVPKLRI